MGLGAENWSVVTARNDAALLSAIQAFLACSFVEFSPSALERIKDKLKEVSDRIENMGRVGNNEDVKAVAQLVDHIRDAVTDCKVSGEVLTR